MPLARRHPVGDPPVFVLDGFWYGIKALTEVRQHWIMVDGSSVAGVLRGGRTTDQHGVGYHLLKPRRRFQDADQLGISLSPGLVHHERQLLTSDKRIWTLLSAPAPTLRCRRGSARVG